jgi:hypothetical protein
MISQKEQWQKLLQQLIQQINEVVELVIKIVAEGIFRILINTKI